MYGHDKIKRLVVLDFETYYDTLFSLSKLSTQQYIMDDRFETILLGADEVTEEPLTCDAVGMTAGAFWHFDEHQINTALRALRLDEPGTLTVAHNAQFDGGILEWRYGIKPWMYLCTMMGARPHLIQHTQRGQMSLKEVGKVIGMEKGTEVVQARNKGRREFATEPASLNEYGRYCVQDVAICRALAERILPTLPPDELRLLDLTVKQFTRPTLRLSAPVLIRHLQDLRQQKDNLLTDCGLSDAAELRSNEKFAQLLLAHGVTPPLKISLATGRETYAFAKSDEAFKREVLESPNDTVALLGAARVGHKSSLAQSRAERFLLLSKLDRPVGMPALYCGAHTGRVSGYDSLNIQNLPRGSALRRALCAPAGHVIVAGDLSQIEARVLAALAPCPALLALFSGGHDPYKKFAADIYRIGLDDVTNEQRRIAKSAVLGLGFGMGPDKFADYLRIMGVTGLAPRVIRRLVHDHYRGTFHEVAQLWADAGSRWMLALAGVSPPQRHGPLCLAKHFIGLPNGMPIHYTNLAREKDNEVWGVWYGPAGNRKRIYGGKLVENAVQALARIIVMRALLWIDQHSNGLLTPVFTVHDELLYVVPERLAEKMANILHTALTRPVPWLPDLPVEAEVKIGLNYGEMEEWQR
jgi:DNA polymerase